MRVSYIFKTIYPIYFEFNGTLIGQQYDGVISFAIEIYLCSYIIR